MVAVFLTILMTLVLAAMISVSFLLPAFTRTGSSKSSTGHATVKTVRTFTEAEVAEHRTRNDCWIIVKSKVYNVTSYVEEHPGGDAILVHAGGDSTKGFFGPQHGTKVFELVDDFYIGNLQ